MVLKKLLSIGSTDIKLPRSLGPDTVFPLIDSVIDDDENPRHSSVTFDWRPVEFAYPIGVTVLSNLVEYLRKHSVKVRFGAYSERSLGIHFLDDAGFFRQYLGRPLDQKASLRPSTLPLELVSYEKSYNYVERTLIPWLSGVFALPETQLGTIKVCFQEIFNNIKDHSKEHIGCSFAQYFPGKKEVVIAISDFGVGIPANVEKIEKGLTDQRAIAMACNEGFTTQSTGTNRGAGLDVLIRNVVGRNKGTLIIYSRKGILSCTPGGALGSRTPRPARGFYPGTLLNLILKVDNELGDGETETFSWTS